MSAYTVGIDLGTTHTVVAYAPANGRVTNATIRLFEIEQLVAPGEVAARALMPSLRYHPAPGELAAGALALSWGPSADGAVVGSLARQLGSQVQGRLVASAKSWLSHAAVDRLAPILPWSAPDDVPKVSPVAASASYLAHLRSAWNHRHPQARLENQELVLTMPASFDDVARALTLQAARDAGLPSLRLLEEPQAALYDWLFRHRRTLADELADTRLLLVCDVGGGTTDLSLVRVEMHGGEPRLERFAVLQATLAAWRGAPLKVLDNAEPDIAVARGAVAYALARRGLAPRIGGGSARSYFLLLEGDGGDDAKRAVCVLPHGSEEGHELPLEGRTFALTSEQPVRFNLVATTAGSVPAGALVDLMDLDAQPLPPLATVVRGGKGPGRRETPVRLASTLTEVGTLALHCVATDDPEQRWLLEFQLRGDGGAAVTPGLPPRFGDAVAALERVFGARDRHADPKGVRQLRTQLEALLGHRERWSVALSRSLFDALWQRARGRRRSADHERLWLSLAGWCLRPGFGDALDGWRSEQLWPIFEQGVQHGLDAQVCAEWWTLWRRVAGGLDEAAQQRLLDDFAFNLRGGELGEGARQQRSPRLVKGSWDDMVRLGASLERIAAEHKTEIGDWLVEQLQGPAAKAHGPWTLWAIGRLGSRVPFHGSAHRVVPVETAAGWLDALLALDWKQVEGAAAAAANLARMSGDRARDLSHDARERLIARLEAAHAPPSWIAGVRDVVPLDEAGERSVFGEALPVGLKLID